MFYLLDVPLCDDWGRGYGSGGGMFAPLLLLTCCERRLMGVVCDQRKGVCDSVSLLKVRVTRQKVHVTRQNVRLTRQKVYVT